MAKAVINLQKESGGIVKISPVDGTGVTELVVPESGNLVSVGTAVTDNAIARYDGTTGKLQNSSVIIDDNGNVGIGTNNPTLSLEVSNGTNTGYIHPGFGIGLSVGTKNNSVLTFDTNNNERVRIDASGNLLLTSGTGALGYGPGAGGSVTQLTSKSTAVTLNKPCGTVITHNESLMAGGLFSFGISNNMVNRRDTISISIDLNTANSWVYRIDAVKVTTGLISVAIKNNSAGALSDNIIINFSIIKGSDV